MEGVRINLSRKRSQMSYRSIVSNVLRGLGYRLRKGSAYRAEWSTDGVEHFIYLTLYGTPKNFISLDFGVRNLFAQNFAIHEIQKYGGPQYSALKYDEDNDCVMTFSLGKMSGWSPRWSLNGADFSAKDLSYRIKNDVEFRLFPAIQPLKTAKDLLSFLLIDAEPCPWVRSNEAIRAAQIIHLGRQVGMGSSEIRTALEPHEKAIASCLIKAPNPSSYLDSVIRDGLH